MRMLHETLFLEQGIQDGARCSSVLHKIPLWQQTRRAPYLHVFFLHLSFFSGGRIISFLWMPFSKKFVCIKRYSWKCKKRWFHSLHIWDAYSTSQLSSKNGYIFLVGNFFFQEKPCDWAVLHNLLVKLPLFLMLGRTSKIIWLVDKHENKVEWVFSLLRLPSGKYFLGENHLSPFFLPLFFPPSSQVRISMVEQHWWCTHLDAHMYKRVGNLDEFSKRISYNKFFSSTIQNNTTDHHRTTSNKMEGNIDWNMLLIDHPRKKIYLHFFLFPFFKKLETK